jgi:molybdopterin-guanine dinucleotide biosynthesis protein A
MGRSKASLDFGGEASLSRIVRILSDVASSIVVVAAMDQELPAIPAEVQVVHDKMPFEGPLAGLAEGLEALPASCAAAYVSCCDSPLLKPEWVTLLAMSLGEADIAMPFAEGREQPLSAVYRPYVAATARRLLAEDRRRPVFLCETHRTVRVLEYQLRQVDPVLETLQNANTPEEYEALVARWRSRKTIAEEASNP